MAQGDVLEEMILPRASDASQQSNEGGQARCACVPSHLGGGSAGGRPGAIADTIRVLWSYKQPPKPGEREEAKKNQEAARLWISGLEAVERKLGLRRIIDLSATALLPPKLRGTVKGRCFTGR